MTDDAKLVHGLEVLKIPMEPSIDSSGKPEYMTYSYFSGSQPPFGDNTPLWERLSWSLHYVAPRGQNRIDIRQQIKVIILSLFGEWPSEENATDGNCQHFIYQWTSVREVIHGTNGS